MPVPANPSRNGYTPPTIDVDDPADPLAAAYRSRGLSDADLRRVAGNLASTHIEQGELPRSLDALGVRPDEVTDLVFTHLHFDHIGWASADGVPFFPNATIWCASADLEHFLAGPDEERFVAFVYHALPAAQRLDPVLDRIETWETDRTLVPGVDVRLAPGHIGSHPRGAGLSGARRRRSHRRAHAGVPRLRPGPRARRAARRDAESAAGDRGPLDGGAPGGRCAPALVARAGEHRVLRDGDVAQAVPRPPRRGGHRLRRALPVDGHRAAAAARRRAARHAVPSVQRVHGRAVPALPRSVHRGGADPDAHARRGGRRARARQGSRGRRSR